MTWINKNVKDLGPIPNFERVKKEFHDTISQERVKYKFDQQLGLQYPDGWDVDAHGPLEWSGTGKPSEMPGQFQHNEELFKNILPHIKGTYIEELIAEHNLFKSRSAVLKPKSCYTWHYDNWPRIHFVIESNPKCFFLFGDQGKVSLEEGRIYFTDTTDPAGHTAINASWYKRIHIFGNIKEFEGRTWEMTEERKEANVKARDIDYKRI